MKYEEKITTLPHGTAIVKGTEIRVLSILRLLEEGKKMDEIITVYPVLTTADISACVEYATELVIISDFKKITEKINKNYKDRHALADKIRALKGSPPPGWEELGAK